jgi:hypothetical protein
MVVNMAFIKIGDRVKFSEEFIRNHNITGPVISETYKVTHVTGFDLWLDGGSSGYPVGWFVLVPKQKTKNLPEWW